MSIYDAQSQNTARSTRQYTDLDLFFGRKTSDSDIRKVTDVQAVKRSIRNLFNSTLMKNLFVQIYLVVLGKCCLNLCPLLLHTHRKKD